MENATISQGAEVLGRNPYTMTSEILRRRLQRENRGRYITQFSAAVVASLAALSFGIVLGWATPAAHRIMTVTSEGQKRNLTVDQHILGASLMPLGCSLGIIPWSYSIKKIGPKHTMILQTPFHIFTFLLTITFRREVTYWTSRFFSGFTSISFVIAGECLLVDSVHRGNYSHMIVFFNSSVLLGVLVSYLVGHFISKLWLTLICTLIPALNTFFLFFIPESPVFLCDKSELKAEKALSWYRGRENIYIELRYIKKDAELRKTGADSYNYMLYSKVVMKAIAIVMGLTFFQVFSGYYAFMFYNVMLWKTKWKYVFDKLTDSTIFGFCMYLSNLTTNVFHYRPPHIVRKPLLISCCLVSVTLSALTAYLFCNHYKYQVARNFRWVPFASLISFFISYEIGLGTYPSIILWEYLPYQVYPAARTFVRIFSWFQVFLLTRYFIPVRRLIGDHFAFGILSIISYLNILYCTWFVIETKGKTLQQIQMEIGGNPIGNRGAYRTHNVLITHNLMRVNEEET